MRHKGNWTAANWNIYKRHMFWEIDHGMVFLPMTYMAWVDSEGGAEMEFLTYIDWKTFEMLEVGSEALGRVW